MSIAAAAIDQAATAKAVDESLWWDSFVALFEELDAAPLSLDLADRLVKKVKSYHGWFLESVTRFKSPNQASRLALDSPQISIGSHRLVVKPELKEAALRVSSCLCLDEVQSYILVYQICEYNELAADIERENFLHSVLLQYYHERQCLFKCIRRIFVHALCKSNESRSSDAVVVEAMQLVRDGLERNLLSTLIDLLSSATSEKSEVDFTILWVEESVIEDNLILDTLFLVYYDNFCSCSCVQWKRLCSIFQDILSGSFSTGKLAVSLEAATSFDRAKFQLLLILIETLDLENLMQMVHDGVPFSQGGSLYSLSDVQEMDALVSSISVVGTKEAAPLVLAWAVYICLLLSLPARTESSMLEEIDHIAHLRQAFEAAPFNYLLEVLRGDALRDSDGPISGYLSVLRTAISAFIASYELNPETAENTLKLILDVLSEIYLGEDSLSMQFWDRDSFVDEPIRSLLYMLESDYPFHTVELVRLLSALCSGVWSAECVYNFLEKMSGITLLSAIPGISQVVDSSDIIAAPIQLDIPSVEGLVIPKGTRGCILKVIDSSTALIRWEFPHSGLLLLLLRLTQKSNLCSYEEVSIILDLLDRMISSNMALCFRFLCFEKSVPTQDFQNNGNMHMNVRVDLPKIICTMAFNFAQDVNNSHILSICIHILAEILKSAPCHVTEAVSRSNIFVTPSFNSSSSTWLLSGGLAWRLLADFEENGDCSLLATSVLELTHQLLEKGGDDNLSSALVVFSLQYILVNHMHWKYALKNARWKVTLKALEVMKSCIKAIKVSHKLGSIIRDILFFDSSIHNILCQIICISPTELERSNTSRHYELKEIEGLQLVVCSGLDIVHTMLAEFLKFQETCPNEPTFIQTILSSTTKPVPIVVAAAKWINFFQNFAIQEAAAKVFSKLCVVASRVQPSRIDNVCIVVDASQINELNTTIFRILDEELDTNEGLILIILDLLTSATHYQPTFLVSLMMAEDMTATTANAGYTNDQLSLTSVFDPVLSRAQRTVDLIMKYVKRSEILLKSGPRLLLSVLNLLKALWDGGFQYIHILEKFRRSDVFWKHLLSILSIEVKIDLSAKSLKVSNIQCTSYRYLCQATVLEIVARELFLLEKLIIANEIPAKKITTGSLKELDENRLHTETSKSSDVRHPSDILSTCFGSLSMDSLLRSYSSSAYDKEVIHRAQIAICLCLVHLIAALSTGTTGSLSISLVEKITTLSQKLYNHPAFSALLAQYLSQGYSEGKELTTLVLNDLYYHIQGEFEGRQIPMGPFQELLHFLLETELFQFDEFRSEEDGLPPGNIVSIFDTNQVRAELGMELWEHSGWKESIEVAEQMLLHMQEANSIVNLSVSKYSSLKALVALISMHLGNGCETKSKAFDNKNSKTLGEPSIRYVCKCLQETGDSLIPALSPPEILLKVLAAQAELLLSLSMIILRQNFEPTNRKKCLPLSLLLIKTSGLAIRSLVDVKSSTTVINKAVQFLLVLLLTSIGFIYPRADVESKPDLEVGQFAEVSLTSMGLLPILCKYTEHAELSNLSLAIIDLMLKGFLAPNIWLPIVENHLQLHHIVQRFLQKDDEYSVLVTLNFLLTLSHNKRGAQMLYAGNVFSALKMLFNCSPDHNSLSDNLDGTDVSNIINSGEKRALVWGRCLAIVTSMVHSLGNDPSSRDILDSAICYFFSEKGHIISHYLSVPCFPFDDQSKKRAHDQKSGTSLTSLKITEHTLTLVCVLAGHQASWSKCMKAMDPKLRETCIHLLAFISKGTQRIGDSPNKCAPLFCPPTIKEELKLDGKTAFVGSKHGWFRLCALGLSAKTKVPSASNGEMTVVTKDQANGNADVVHQTHFSDTVAIQMYRIAFLLLKLLCMQAKTAAKRAEELEFIDLASFPELPMPEILHGLQDQAIAIVTDICEAHKLKPMQLEIEGLCLLLLQILEKTLYLELGVSQSCGIRPVLGRIEDFSKEIKLLMQAVEQHPNLKASMRPLSQIIALVYPGLLQSGTPM